MSETTRLLTAAEMIRLTDDDAPLTPKDVRTIVAHSYSPGRGAYVLDGRVDEYARPHPAGGFCDAGENHRLSWHTDRRGIWAALVDTTPRRAGLIRWAEAEDIIRRAATAEMTADLFRAIEEYRDHAIAPPCAARAEARTGVRLMRAEHDAWDRITAVICGPAPEQLDLFTAE